MKIQLKQIPGSSDSYRVLADNEEVGKVHKRRGTWSWEAGSRSGQWCRRRQEAVDEVVGTLHPAQNSDPTP